MVINDVTTPVVILKLEHYGSLGIARSLGRLGVQVCGVDANPNAPVFHSRYCRGRYVWDVDREEPRKTVNRLLDVRRALGRNALLIPTSDEMALFVAEHADCLRESFIFPVQPAATVRSLCNKKEMFFLAKRFGIPTADTTFPKSRSDVLEFLEHASFPLMLKGIDGGRLEARTGKKMVIVRHRDELLSKYDAMEDPHWPNLMLQEYIPGTDSSVWMFNGYFDRTSDCLFGLTGKKIRQNPVYTGMTSLGVCLSNRSVTQTTLQFMKAIGYSGILDIGYRYDERDRQYKVLDVNPRIGATFRLFVGKKGMDVVRAMYLDQTGQPVLRDTICEGRKWIVEDKDILSTYRYFWDGNLDIVQWARSFRGTKEAGYFASDDLLPFFAMCAHHVRCWLGRASQAIMRKRFLARHHNQSHHAGLAFQLSHKTSHAKYHASTTHHSEGDQNHD